MKKIIPILIVIAFISQSCKKENKACWHCTFGTTNGVTHAPETVCQDSMPVFFDEQGNNLNQNCTK